VVYLHSYLTVFHRAIKAALPPAHGGAVWFALYAVIFTSMTFFIKVCLPFWRCLRAAHGGLTFPDAPSQRERKGKGD